MAPGTSSTLHSPPFTQEAAEAEESSRSHMVTGHVRGRVQGSPSPEHRLRATLPPRPVGESTLWGPDGLGSSPSPSTCCWGNRGPLAPLLREQDTSQDSEEEQSAGCRRGVHKACSAHGQGPAATETRPAEVHFPGPSAARMALRAPQCLLTTHSTAGLNSSSPRTETVCL